MLNRLERFLLRHYLPKLLARACGRSVRRSGKEGEAVNCFSTALNHHDGTPRYWLRKIADDRVEAIEWNGHTYNEPVSLSLDDLDPKNLVIYHYYGLNDINYFGIWDLVIGRIFFWPYVKLYALNALRRFDQHLFNKKKLISKKRIEILDILLKMHLDGKTSNSPLEVMSELYSGKWILHPSGDSELNKLEFLLDSLVESGELTTDRVHYSVHPKAVAKVEEYEEDERRHTENVKMQRRMLYLTIAVVLFAAIEAGLIKVSPVIDISFPTPPLNSVLSLPKNSR